MVTQEDGMSEKTQDMRIDEALKLLNEVARDKGAELQDLVSEKYGDLKSALGGFAEKVEREAHAAYAQGTEKVRDFASRVDQDVHRNPWPFLGGAALGSLLLGFLLGRSRK
jgi:ElaB/YqjD/DUF883 family membrane-anchored ribosome-binding protein